MCENIFVYVRACLYALNSHPHKLKWVQQTANGSRQCPRYLTYIYIHICFTNNLSEDPRGFFSFVCFSLRCIESSIDPLFKYHFYHLPLKRILPHCTFFPDFILEYQHIIFASNFEYFNFHLLFFLFRVRVFKYSSRYLKLTIRCVSGFIKEQSLSKTSWMMDLISSISKMVKL